MNNNEMTVLVRARDQATGVIQRVRQNIQRASAAASDYMNRATEASNSFAAGMAAVGTAVVGATAVGFKFNSALEQAQAKINAFTKDSAKTAEILAFVKDEAAKTQFSFTDMADAAAGLIPAAKMSGESLESLIRQAEILAALNPAEGLVGASFAIREALSGDFVSIVERFNLPRQRLNQLKEQGVPAMKAISIALQEMGIDYSLVDKQGQTTAARFDQIKDKLTQLAGEASKPFFEAVSSSLNRLATWLDANRGRILNGVSDFMEYVKRNAPLITGIVVGLLIPAFIGLAASIWAALAPVLPFVAAGMAIGALLGVLAEKVGGWSVLLGMAREAVSNLWGVLSTALMPSLQALWNTIQSELLPSLQRLWNELSPVLIPLLKLWASVMGSIVVASLWLVINALNVLAQGVSIAADRIRVAFMAVERYIIDPFQRAYNYVRTLPEKMANEFAGIGGMIRRVIGDIDIPGPLGKIKNTIPGFATGGSVTGGQPIVVGERQAEVYIPNTRGRIQPSTAGSETATGVTNNYLTGTFNFANAEASNAFWDRVDKTARLSRMGVA